MYTLVYTSNVLVSTSLLFDVICFYYVRMLMALNSITLWGSSMFRFHSRPAILEIHGYIWWRAKALWSKDFCQNGLRCWNMITQELHRFGQCTLWILTSHVWIMFVFGLLFVEFKWINDDKWVVQYRHSTCYFGTFTYFNSFLVYYTVKLALLEPNYKI
jgi:hypothetical protein